MTTFKERRAALQALGSYLTPDMVGGTTALAAPTIDPAIYDGVEVSADLAYGEHERQVLDVYSSAGDRDNDRPVLVYVHGGGFVRGAKNSNTTPYFTNIGSWAVQQGWVGVVINYRLAPEFRYPCGAQDVASAITWVVEHIGEYGGDAGKIFLAGQSAGSMHVADYIVGHGGTGPHGRSLAGAILVSCLYDVSRTSINGVNDVYWGSDTSKWVGYSTLSGLIDTDLPLALTVSEFDEPEFQDQAAHLVATWYAAKGFYPPMHFLYSQNHLTPVYSLGSPDDGLGSILKRFVEVNS